MGAVWLDSCLDAVMPEKVSPTLKILTEMRDELKRSNSRLGVVEKRLEPGEKDPLTGTAP